jgi:hypothetical protein
MVVGFVLSLSEKRYMRKFPDCYGFAILPNKCSGLTGYGFTCIDRLLIFQVLCFVLICMFLRCSVNDVGMICNLSFFLQITWQWLPFTSSARKDNLELYHWVGFFT